MGSSTEIPLLGPGVEALRALVRLPAAQLRSAAAQRGIELGARATRGHVARALIAHASRERTERDYRDTGTAFHSRDVAYPHVRRAIQRHRLRRLVDIGCGAGVFAEELARADALGPRGAYSGVDLSPAAIELARGRFAGDARFAFAVGDAEGLGDRPLLDDASGVVLAFVLSYLDTHAVDRLIGRVAALYPPAHLVVALTFRSCVDRRADAPEDGSDDARELSAARRFLAGDRRAAEAIWDTRRFHWYRRSIEARYRIADERVLRATAQLVWVAAPRIRPSSRSRRRSDM